jgi:XisI protein
VGWEDGFRMYGCLIHVDIKDGKIWIQYDGTEYSVANELIDLGVPKQDIVLAYHAPYARKYTEFATS